MELQEFNLFYNKVGGLDVKSKNDTIGNLSCSINRFGIFSHSKINVFSCSCSGTEVEICEECAKLCHKNHRYKQKPDQSKFLCGCALVNHEVNFFRKSSKNLDCSLNEIFHLTNVKYYYSLIVAGRKEIYCLYCMNFCLKQTDDFHKISKENMDRAPQCNCTNQQIHSNEKNYSCLSQLIENKDDFKEYFNLGSLTYLIISNNDLFEKFVSPIISKHNEILMKMKDNDYVSLQGEIVPNQYTYCTDVFVKLSKISKKQYYLINNREFKESINLEFLKTIFTTTEVSKDFFAYVKYYSLKLFRKFCMLPMMRSNFLSKVGEDSNTTGLHRLIFNDSISMFFKQIKISQEEYFELINTIYNSIVNYSEKIDYKLHIDLIREFIKYSILVLRNNFVDFAFIEDTISRITKLNLMFIGRKSENNKLSSDIRNLIYFLILKQNDENLYQNLFIPKDKIEKKDYFFEDNENSNLLIKCLFVDSLNLKEYPISKKEIFDLLINQNDLYIEGLRNLQKGKFLTSNLTLFFEDNFDDENFFSSLTSVVFKKFIHQLGLFKTDYIENRLGEKEFFNKVSTILKDILLNSGLFAETKANEICEERFYQQLTLFKNNLFNEIINIWDLFENNDYLRNSVGEECYDSLYFHIVDVLLLLVEDNPFLTSLFFNDNMIDRFFKVKIARKEKKMTPFKCYEFFVRALKILIKFDYKVHFIYFINTIFEFESIRDWHKNLKISNILFKILFMTLELSHEKTSSELNQIIADALKIVLKSKELTDLINATIKYYKSGLITDLIRNRLPEIITLIKTKFRIIRNFKSEYFILISEYIDYRRISILLKNMEINPRTRQVLIKSYTRYFFIENFRIITPTKKDNFDSLAEISICNNLIGSHSDDFEEYNLIIENLENYPEILLKYKKSFNINNELYFSYFVDVILFPIKNCIYKLLYFSKSVTAKMKYLIYKLTYLFLENYRHFIKCFESFNINPESVELLEKYFIYQTLSFDDLMNFLDKNINILKGNNFNLNLNKVIEMFTNATKDFVCLKKSDKKENEEIAFPNEIYANLNKFIESYIIAKSDESNNKINSIFEECDDPIIQEIKENITLNLICMLDFTTDKSENEFYTVCESNVDLFICIDKLFKIDPKVWQRVLSKLDEKLILMLTKIISKQLPYLFQIVFINFNKLESNDDDTSFQHFILLIEFLRLFAETHNKVYQTVLINYFIDKESNFKLNYFFLKIPTFVLNHISYFKAKKQFLSLLKNDSTSYFDNLIEYITNYLIEIIQGSYEFNLDEFVESEDGAFYDYCDKNYKYFDEIENEEEYELILSHFMKLINALIEEHSNSLQNKNNIIKKMNPKKMLAAALYCIKKLFKKYQDPENKIEVVNFHFDDKTHLKLRDYYLANEDFIEETLFALSGYIFIYLKTVESFPNGEKSKTLLESLKTLSESKNTSEKGKSNWYLKTQTYLFFDGIIKNVEISFKSVETIIYSEFVNYKKLFAPINKQFKKIMKIITDGRSKNSLIRIVFFASPKSLYLTELDMDHFLFNAPFENFDQKLSFLIENLEVFLDILGVRTILYMSKSRILNYFYNIDYEQIKLISIYFALVINLISIFTVKKRGDLFYDPQENLVNLIANTHNIFTFFFIFNYMAFEMFKLHQFAHNREIDKPFLSKLYSYISLLGDQDIFYLVFSFFFGVIANLDKRYHFAFSLLLFPIFEFFPTMKSVTLSVQMRYQQFSYTAFLIVILILLYSSISFLYFQDSYYSVDLGQNICSSYLQCFLTMFNYGIRSGGIGDFSSYKSYEDKKNYWGNFIFNWIFYFSIVLIMINIVNGIIVDTFQALREESSLKFEALNNICFICSLKRSKFEINGLNYAKHTNNEHNLQNYFHYLIKVKSSVENDLNSLDYQVLNDMKEEKFDFFPIKKAISLEKLEKKA